MSASGKSSNRRTENARGYSGAGGHGIYAEQGRADRRAAKRRTPAAPTAAVAPSALPSQRPDPTGPVADPQPAPMTRAERIVGRLTGKALLWLGKRAADRRDWHEVNHCIAALAIGASDHPGECGMPHDQTIRQRPHVTWDPYQKGRP